MTATKLIAAHLDDLERDQDLLVERNFAARADALEILEFHVLERLSTLQDTPFAQHRSLQIRAQNLKTAWEGIDNTLFNRLKSAVQSGEARGSQFKKMISGHCPLPVEEEAERGYDNLDLFLNGITTPGPVPEPSLPAAPGMVFYQKTPCRVVIEMAAQAQFSCEDHFMDLGSGLGQVTILVHLLSGVPATGIEYEPAYYSYACGCALELGLDQVEFKNVNALHADYSRGTVFFLYTPFEGNMLVQVLRGLGETARKRAIRVFSYGPCSKQVAATSWLKLTTGDARDAFCLCGFESMEPACSGNESQADGNEH